MDRNPPNLEVHETGLTTFFTHQICGFPELKLPAQLERGTPIENKVDELHSIFDFVNYGYLGDQEHVSTRSKRWDIPNFSSQSFSGERS